MTDNIFVLSDQQNNKLRNVFKSHFTIFWGNMNTEMIICSEDIKICIEDQNFLKNVSMNIKNIANIQFENITGENVEKK